MSHPRPLDGEAEVQIQIHGVHLTEPLGGSPQNAWETAPHAAPALNIVRETAEAVAIIKAMRGVFDYAMVGSALYLPGSAHDIDFAVMLAEGTGATELATELTQEYPNPWFACGEYDADAGTWCSVRRGNLNLMLTHDRAFFDGYVKAMEVCKVLRLESKDQRIAVCKVVRDGLSADEVFNLMPQLALAVPAAESTNPLPARTVFRIKRECDALGLGIVAFAWRIQREGVTPPSPIPEPLQTATGFTPEALGSDDPKN